jgi:phosphate ABC transporter phosphate-binding protein
MGGLFGRRGAAVRAGRILAAVLVGAPILLALGPSRPAMADSYVPVSGAGSTWSQNAIDQWRRDVEQYGMRVNYAGTGSSDGRRQWLNGTVDFAASDIPFQFHPEDGSPPENPTAGSYAYVPVTAGGTVFMYNLSINGQRVTNLRLSGANIAKIFTGGLTKWNDPAIAADNPGLTLPNRQIVPVVRSDGSGSTAQFSLWLISQQSSIWNAYCHSTGRSACGETSYYPTIPGMIAQAGDLGVAGYVSQSYADGAIGYVNYSYALNAGFPVAKMLNSAGYYTEPTPDNVAVSLLKAQVNTDASSELYLTQELDGVYSDTDPRTYPLSSYSYMILPTTIQGQFTTAKGKTLGAFMYYAMCQGQQQSASLGYSPMPVNLVQDGFDQIRKIPGVVVQNVTIQGCNNPTFSSDGTNKLADEAPMPADCDKQGPNQCTTGTGGAHQPTPVKASATGSGGGSSSGGSSGGGSSGGSSGGSGSGGSSSAAVSAGSGSQTGARGATTGRTSTGGTNGSGANGSSGGTAGAATPAAAAAQQSCVDTGNCATGSAAGSSDGAATGDPSAQVASASPLTLPAKKGWSGTQTLMLLAGLITVGLIAAPAIATRVLERRHQ